MTNSEPILNPKGVMINDLTRVLGALGTTRGTERFKITIQIYKFNDILNAECLDFLIHHLNPNFACHI